MGVQPVYVPNIQLFFSKSNRFVKIFCIFVKLFSQFCLIFVTKNYFVLKQNFWRNSFFSQISPYLGYKFDVVYIQKYFANGSVKAKKM